jgi:hypothetical protein
MMSSQGSSFTWGCIGACALSAIGTGGGLLNFGCQITDWLLIESSGYSDRTPVVCLAATLSRQLYKMPHGVYAEQCGLHAVHVQLFVAPSDRVPIRPASAK